MDLLLTKLASLGDLILTLPALSDALSCVDSFACDWVVDQSFQEIPRWHKSVRTVFQTNHRVWRKNLLKKTTWNEIKQICQSIHHPYDLILDAHGNFKTALLGRCAIGKRAGFNLRSIPEPGAQLFYHKKYDCKAKHMLFRQRELFAQALGYPLPQNTPNYGISEFAFPSPGIDLPKKYFVFVPIASTKEKLWKEQFWKQLFKASKYPIFLPWATLEEKKLVERLACKGVYPLPKMNLSHLAFILKRAETVVSLDTGLSHLSVALGTPCITLYGPTDPEKTGTIGEGRWIQAKTMNELTPDQVICFL